MGPALSVFLLLCHNYLELHYNFFQNASTSFVFEHIAAPVLFLKKRRALRLFWKHKLKAFRLAGRLMSLTLAGPDMCEFFKESADHPH